MNDEAPAHAHFDTALQAWVFSRYADVSGALGDARLVPQGDSQSHTVQPGDGTQAARRAASRESHREAHREAHRTLHRATALSVSAERVANWRPAMETLASTYVGRLAVNAPVELVGNFFTPWSLDVACLVTGMSTQHAEACAPAARDMYLAAAVATDGRPSEVATRSASQLAGVLSESRAEHGRPVDLQTFVALTQSLPATLANVWHTLLTQQQQFATLRSIAADPRADWPAIVGELLRVASPARAVFRSAIEDAEIGGAQLQAGDDAVLMLSLANKDPAVFPSAGRIDFANPARHHLGLGAGPHHCAGATLVRTAIEVASRALLTMNATPSPPTSPDSPENWIGGFAIRAKKEQYIVLSK